MTDVPPLKSPCADDLYRRITTRDAHIGVVGLGYVGLGLAVEFSRAGFRVCGIDTDAARRDAINRGVSDVPDVPSSLLHELVTAERLRAVPDMSESGPLDAVAICVPTPLRKTKDPDLSHVLSAVHETKQHLRTGMLVILESTTYPGTTEEIVKDILETTGLVAGQDFFLVFSPERVDPGNRTWTNRNVPKVIGGVTRDCSELAAALYGTAVERVVPVSSPRTAEMVKLLENTFRAVNIGLVNELAVMCDRMGVSIWEVIDAAATKPFGFMPFYPGPGLGGHCIPVDPFYLSWKAREVGMEARFIDLAGRVNAEMPHYVVQKIGDALNEQRKPIRGSRILVLGVAYKADVSDVRESPALDVMALLLYKGASVSYHDPHVAAIEAERWPGGVPMRSVPYSAATIESADCVVLLTDHQGFDYAEIASTAHAIVDTRGSTRGAASRIFRLGEPDPGRQR